MSVPIRVGKLRGIQPGFVNMCTRCWFVLKNDAHPFRNLTCQETDQELQSLNETACLKLLKK